MAHIDEPSDDDQHANEPVPWAFEGDELVPIVDEPDILSAVDALMERHTERQLDADAWAEQISESLSRFTD